MVLHIFFKVYSTTRYRQVYILKRAKNYSRIYLPTYTFRELGFQVEILLSLAGVKKNVVPRLLTIRGD